MVVVRLVVLVVVVAVGVAGVVVGVRLLAGVAEQGVAVSVVDRRRKPPDLTREDGCFTMSRGPREFFNSSCERLMVGRLFIRPSRSRVARVSSAAAYRTSLEPRRLVAGVVFAGDPSTDEL